MKVGILALQGAFVEHARRFARLGCETFEIRQRAHIPTSFDALVLPGGESTAQGLLLRELGLFEPLREAITGRVCGADNGADFNADFGANGAGANSNLSENLAQNFGDFGAKNGAKNGVDFERVLKNSQTPLNAKISAQIIRETYPNSNLDETSADGAKSNLNENRAKNGANSNLAQSGVKNRADFADFASTKNHPNLNFDDSRADGVNSNLNENVADFLGTKNRPNSNLSGDFADFSGAKNRAKNGANSNLDETSAGANPRQTPAKPAPHAATTPRGVRVLATCAGAILLAKRLENDPAAHFATLDAVVRRNAYGRQLGSFHALGEFAGLGRVPMTFIRAPIFTAVGAGVRVLARVGGAVVAVSGGNQLALSFHPELDENDAIFEYFLGLRGDFMADSGGGFGEI